MPDEARVGDNFGFMVCSLEFDSFESPIVLNCVLRSNNR